MTNLCFFGSSSILIHCTVTVALSTAFMYAVGTQLDELVVVSTYVTILAVTMLRLLRSRISLIWLSSSCVLSAVVSILFYQRSVKR